MWDANIFPGPSNVSRNTAACLWPTLVAGLRWRARGKNETTCGRQTPSRNSLHGPDAAAHSAGGPHRRNFQLTHRDQPAWLLPLWGRTLDPASLWLRPDLCSLRQLRIPPRLDHGRVAPFGYGHIPQNPCRHRSSKDRSRPDTFGRAILFLVTPAGGTDQESRVGRREFSLARLPVVRVLSLLLPGALRSGKGKPHPGMALGGRELSFGTASVHGPGPESLATLRAGLRCQKGEPGPSDMGSGNLKRK